MEDDRLLHASINDPVPRKPVARVPGRFGKGNVPMAMSPSDVKIPNWVQEYNFFRSTKGNTSSKAIRNEYMNVLDKWLTKNPNGTVEDFRKTAGIVIDEQGRELLTSQWKGERLRNMREKAQRPSGSRTAGEPRQMVNKPFWATDANGDTIVKLEGHHKKGLANLGVFFDGATPEEAFSMRQAMLNEDFVGGTDKRNWAWLTQTQHDLAHKYLGYASDAEVAAAPPGTKFYDLDTQGKKGVSNVSQDTRKIIESLPYTNKNPNYKGQSVYSGKKINMKNLTRQDLLMDYLRTTYEGFDNAVTQARQRAPYAIRLKDTNPGLYESLKPVVGLGESASKAAKQTLKMGRHLLGPASVGITGNQARLAIGRAATNPTVANKIWAGLRGAEAGLDAAGLAASATGVGLPLGAAAEIGSMVLGLGTDAAQAIHNKGLKIKNTDLSNTTRKSTKATKAEDIIKGAKRLF